MHEVFKRRQLAEQIVLRAATQEISTVLDLGINKKHFIGEWHADIFDYLVSLDKNGYDISSPQKTILMMENPSPKYQTILDIYKIETKKYNLLHMIDVLKQWSQFDLFKERAAKFIHRVDTWDFKDDSKELFELAHKITDSEELMSLDSISTASFGDEWLANHCDGLNKTKTIQSGIFYLDRKLSGGFKTTKLYTVAARTGCGKTAFATNILLNAAKQGFKALYVTLEMNKMEITDRLSSCISEVPIEKYANSNFTATEKNLVISSGKFLKELPISIFCKSKGDFAEVEKYIRMLNRKRGLNFVVIDYIQQYNCKSLGFKMSDKRQELDFMTGRLKQLALELDFCAIMLAQLNRDIDKDSTREPRLSDIKESSSIEQDSDAVLFLYCTNQEQLDSGMGEEREISLKIGKNRSGNTGISHLHTKLSINKFYPD